MQSLRSNGNVRIGEDRNFMYILIMISGAVQIANWVLALVDKLEEEGRDENEREQQNYSRDD